MATIGLALIARNAEQYLEKCLASVAPYVDQIVVVLGGVSTDKTEEIARKFTSEVYPYEWKDDFADARNYSYSFLKTDWQLWIDADDTLENADMLRGVVENLAPDIGAVIFPYYYAFDTYGNCTTVIERKRLTRASVGWHWQDRVHEDIIEHQRTRYAKETQLVVRHQHNGYETEARNSGERNLKILLESYKAEPDNVRHWKYLGFQYFAMQQWETAIYWMLKFSGDPRGVTIERWQQLCYAAKAYIELGRNEDAFKCAREAQTMLPHLADGWLTMGKALARMGDFERAIFWTEEGMKRDPNSMLAFFNPTEFYVQPHEILYHCYWGLAKVDEAIHHAEKAYERVPSPIIKDNLDSFREMKQLQLQVEGIMTLKNALTETEAFDLAQRLPSVRMIPEVRDLYAVPMLNLRTARHTQPKIIFYCPPMQQGFSPLGKALGGSETALVEIAKRFASAGWQVDVFANPGTEEGNIDRQGWWEQARYRSDMKADVLVGWRVPPLFYADHAAEKKLLWCHDLNYREEINEKIKVDKVLGVSDWHASYLRAQYPFLSDAQISFVPNGINGERFANRTSVVRQRRKVIYTSSADRGLDHLLWLWRRFIAPQEGVSGLRYEDGHQPELHIFYGWEGIDSLIRQGNLYLRDFKANVMDLANHPSIHMRGRVDQETLAREMLSADLWLYPTEFLETHCISAIECMAAGVTPITSAYGNLPHVLGDAGFCVPGKPRSTGFLRTFMGCVLASFSDEPEAVAERERKRQIGYERAKGMTWDASFEKHWLPLVERKVLAEIAG